MHTKVPLNQGASCPVREGLSSAHLGGFPTYTNLIQLTGLGLDCVPDTETQGLDFEPCICHLLTDSQLTEASP